MNTKRAFTLIELLVVIAIIAILAAILFPVFAQAKAAAKVTKTVSNQKQLATGFALYQGDNDDTFQMRGTMNGNGASWASGACNGTYGCLGWDTVMYPYLKNVQIFESDFDRIPKGLWLPFGEAKRSFRVAGNVVRGWAGFNTWDGQDYGWTGTSATSVARPGDTILLTEQRDAAILTAGSWPGFWSWEGHVWDAHSPNTLSNDDPAAYGTETNAQRRYASGVDFANANRAVYTFVDGHVKTYAKGYIFPGYERRKNTGSAVDNTLKGVCLDADPFRPAASDCALPQ